jgi:peroxiredoxin
MTPPDDGVVDHVWYPVFGPAADAAAVIDWLRAHP